MALPFVFDFDETCQYTRAYMLAKDRLRKPWSNTDFQDWLTEAYAALFDAQARLEGSVSQKEHEKELARAEDEAEDETRRADKAEAELEEAHRTIDTLADQDEVKRNLDAQDEIATLKDRVEALRRRAETAERSLETMRALNATAPKPRRSRKTTVVGGAP